MFIKDTYFEYSPEKFDYSVSDSLFLNSNPENNDSDSTKITDKKVDYEQELLDFSENELLSQKDNSKRVLININTADISELTTLPGVGEITAKRIIEFRTRRNGINNLDQLLQVKGIGKSKLEKIKKFLIIE